MSSMLPTDSKLMDMLGAEVRVMGMIKLREKGETHQSVLGMAGLLVPSQGKEDISLAGGRSLRLQGGPTRGGNCRLNGRDMNR